MGIFVFLIISGFAVGDDLKCENSNKQFAEFFEVAQNLKIQNLLWEKDFTDLTILDVLNIASNFTNHLVGKLNLRL